MGFFGRQMSNVVEWEENRDDVIFWKWNNNQIKRGSTLIIRPGQDAIFMCDGRIEGIFEDEGRYDIESQIIPFLSSLKGFKFGFKSEMRAEVLFVNTRELTVKWGTKSPVMIPSKDFPAGLAIRAYGTFNCKVTDYVAMIDKFAGVKDIYTIEDIRDRVISALGQPLMKHIGQTEGDIFELQQNAAQIAKGVKEDLDMQMFKDGITITDFCIANFSYPEEVYEYLRQAK